MATGLTYIHPDKPRSLFINEVGVAADHHRQGIGTQLISSLLEWGKSKGCVEAWVATEVENSAARLFYQSTGGAVACFSSDLHSDHAIVNGRAIVSL